MKRKRIRRLAPCPAYEVEKIESWLSDMAKDGWILEKDGEIFGWLAFVRDVPRTVRYRLEPKAQGVGFGDVPDPEIQGLCEEYGWEYADSYGDFFIYRSTRSDAREMNTDLDVQAAALKSGKRSSTASMVLEVILCVSLYHGMLQAPYWYLASFGLTYHLAFLGALIWCSLESLLRWRHLRKLQKQLKANIPLDHAKPWKPDAAFYLLNKVVYVLVILILFGVLFSSCTHSLDLEYTDTARYPGDPPFVTASELLENSVFEPQSFLHGYNAYTEDSNFFATRTIDWKEYGEITTSDGKTYDGSLIITYYALRWEWLAEGLLDDLYEMDEEKSHFHPLTAPELDVDEVLCYNNIYPTLLIRQGNIILRVSVSLEAGGEYMLEEWAHRMAEMLIRE